MHTKATPKARPRVVKRGKYISAYTPKKQFEEVVGLNYRSKELPLYETNIEISIKFYFEPAKSLTKKKRAECLQNKWCDNHGLGDLDNLIKSVLDGLNGIAYKDDSQIVRFGEMAKEYAEQDKVEIVIREIEDAHKE